MTGAGLPAMRETTTGVRIDVRVIPRGSRSGLEGVRDGALLVRVTAPPVDGAANAALVASLAEALGVPRRDLVIVAGERGRRKTIEVRAMTTGTLRDRLSAILG